MPSEVVAAARRFRTNARRRGTPARAVLASRYAKVAADLRRDGLALERRASALRRNGLHVGPELLASLEETRALRLRTQRALLDAADTAMAVVDAETRREVLHALRDARELAKLSTRYSLENRVEDLAVTNLVALADRGPVRGLLRARAGTDADQAAQVLVDGIVRQQPFEATAAKLSQLIDGSSHAAALRLVRTETHRARREAQRVVYLRAGHVTGWVWVCSLTPTSCGLCWAQHGRVFPLSEPMGTHPNCTCECAPYTGTDELTGPELFDALSEAEQDQALGPATARAYRDGALTLPDLVRTAHHPIWGPTGVQSSLVGVLGDRARECYRN